MDEIGFQSANAVVTQIATQVTDQLRAEPPQAYLFTEHRPIRTATIPTLFPTSNSRNPITSPLQTPLALATGTDPHSAPMIALLQTMQAQMDTMRLQMEDRRRPYRSQGERRDRDRKTRNQPRGGGRNGGRGERTVVEEESTAGRTATATIMAAIARPPVPIINQPPHSQI